MTAVAAPVQLQTPSRIGWSSVNASQNGLGSVSQEEVGRIFAPGPRKSAQRTNSSSSIGSLSSASSTASASTAISNGTSSSADTWESRKKATRGFWPPGKSQPTAELSTARPQTMSAAASGASATSGLTALNTPLLVMPMMANQQQQQVAVRTPPPAESSAFLYLLPMNGTFERKTINVPYFPDVLRIGRQTNAKTAPTASNGFFDSKVLSRQHAEIYAEGNGRVYIRDVKSSNGTFVNGKRLSPENKESEPHELREQDVLELGIDIVSEDQKTVVHHKVAARVEHAGMYSQSGEIGLGELDPTNAGFVGNQPRRVGSHAGLPGMRNGVAVPIAGLGVRDPNALQQQWSRTWVQPISTENIVKRLNRELNLARQQSQDIDRARSHLASMLDRNLSVNQQVATASPKVRFSMGIDSFPQPPAPPPTQPLPEKPDARRVLQDPLIQPLLQRSNTARPNHVDGNSGEQVEALFVLTHELKAAKNQIPDLQSRVQMLEQQLRDERTARANAEERANQLEHASRKDSAEPAAAGLPSEDVKAGEISATSRDNGHDNMATLQTQLDRLQASMVEMRTQMEAYRCRAESAEIQRDEARQSLAEMIQAKRASMNASQPPSHAKLSRQRSRSTSASDPGTADISEDGAENANGHTIRPSHARSIALTTLLKRAGVDGGKPLTRQQAASLQRVLRDEMLADENPAMADGREGLSYHGIPHAAAVTTVLVGLVVMRWLNGWERLQK